MTETKVRFGRKYRSASCSSNGSADMLGHRLPVVDPGFKQAWLIGCGAIGSAQEMN